MASSVSFRLLAVVVVFAAIFSAQFVESAQVILCAVAADAKSAPSAVASVELSGKTRVMVNVSSVGGARDLVVVTTFSIDGCLGLLLASQSAPKADITVTRYCIGNGNTPNWPYPALSRSDSQLLGSATEVSHDETLKALIIRDSLNRVFLYRYKIGNVKLAIPALSGCTSTLKGVYNATSKQYLQFCINQRLWTISAFGLLNGTRAWTSRPFALDGVDLLDYAIDATSDSVIGIDRSPFNYEASTLFTYLGGEQVSTIVASPLSADEFVFYSAGFLPHLNIYLSAFSSVKNSQKSLQVFNIEQRNVTSVNIDSYASLFTLVNIPR